MTVFLDVLIVEAGKVPREAKIEDSLQAKQQIVGGLIEAVYPSADPVALVCNESGKINGLPLNRALYDGTGHVYEIICGTFFICGLTNDNFGSLTPELMQKYKELFKHPELISFHDGELRAIKIIPIDDEGDEAED